MNTEQVTVITRNDILLAIGGIHSIKIECKPTTQKNGNFGKFARVCKVEYGGQELEITIQEGRQLLNRLRNYWGRTIVRSRTVQTATKWICKDRDLPLSERRVVTIKGVNWRFDISDPPLIPDTVEPKIAEMP